MRKKRQTDIFSLSFLDCMCCGFGAVILLFMIINSQVKEQINIDQLIPKNNLSNLKLELLESRKELILAKSTFDDVKQKDTFIKDELDRMIVLLAKLKEEIKNNNIDSSVKNESIEKLKLDIKKLSEERNAMLSVTQRLQSG